MVSLPGLPAGASDVLAAETVVADPTVLRDLAPGGGFVFSAVHNIQADVPPANIVAMRRALEEFGAY